MDKVIPIAPSLNVTRNSLPSSSLRCVGHNEQDSGTVFEGMSILIGWSNAYNSSARNKELMNSKPNDLSSMAFHGTQEGIQIHEKNR